MERAETENQDHQQSASSSADTRRTHNSGGRKPAAKNQVVNGTSNGGISNGNSTPSADAELAQEKDAVADAAEDLEAVKIEEEVAA